MGRSPRVRCAACAFEWYGPTAADGLRLIGSCPRCAGELEFLPAAAVPAPAPVVSDRMRRVAPAAVLGTPTTWQH